MKSLDNELVLLYDGECGLCSFAVQFVLRFEKEQCLKFAPLQSEWAKSLLKDFRMDTFTLDSVVLLQNNSIYIKSSALLTLAPYLKFPFNCLVVFKIIPSAFADAIYDWIARNRHRFFKPRCLILSKEQKDRFVD